MIVLPPPSSQMDDQHLAAMCAANWAPLSLLWSSAYANYRIHSGNPWKINATTFVPDIGDQQRALYDSQNQSSRIRAIRDAQLPSCPMCGSPVTGTLDHYLPREEFPEFSVMAANLIPACTHCNSGKKRRTFKGVSTDERFLHPYFDQIASLPIWFVQIVPPYVAATFEPRVALSLSGSPADTVAFHLANVLGKQFFRFVENRWSTFPKLVRNDVGFRATVSPSDVARVIEHKLRDARATSGQNSWESAFLRGLKKDESAQAHILAAVPA